MLTGPPDFVGVGAQRSGTTWWFALLLAHPRVVPPRGATKELHFFDALDPERLGPADVARYHASFPRGARELAGEWTPRYCCLPGAGAMLAAAAPRTRLLMLVRDPVERLASAIAFRRRRGAPGPWDDRRWQIEEGIARGRYAEQIAGLLEHFPEERLLVLQYERCCADPRRELAHTQAFLGLEAHVPARLQPRKPAARPAPELSGDEARAVVEALEAEVAELAGRRPEIDLALWPWFRHLAG